MKKILATLLASAMTLTALGGLVACGEKDTRTEIIVWAPQESKACYEKLADEFVKQEAYKNYKVTIVNKAEDQVQASLATDAAAGADVFFFPSDHLDKLTQDGILLELGGEVGGKYTTAIKERDTAFTYEFVMNEAGNCMAFPATADNGYYLWYNSELLTENDVKTLDGILAKAQEKDMNFMWAYETGWYTPMFFFANGCKCGYEGDNYVIDFDSEAGVQAAEAMVDYLTMKKSDGKQLIINGSIGDDLVAGLKNKTVIAGIGGGWFYDQLPEGTKAAILPTAEINGTQKQLKSFYGGKYCGVNAKRKNLAVAAALADWFTNEAGQQARFEATSTGPSNKNVAASDKVQAAPTVKAIADMVAANAVVNQGNQDPLWEPMQEFCKGIVGDTTTPPSITKANVAEKIAATVAGIKAKA